MSSPRYRVLCLTTGLYVDERGLRHGPAERMGDMTEVQALEAKRVHDFAYSAGDTISAVELVPSLVD